SDSVTGFGGGGGAGFGVSIGFAGGGVTSVCFISSVPAEQPTLFTFIPGGVFGHWSRPSHTPSPPLSCSQPNQSTVQPFGVLTQWSTRSNTPSPSMSTAGQR